MDTETRSSLNSKSFLYTIRPMHLSDEPKKYGLDRLVAACACATEGRLYGYNEVREILEHGDDAAFLSPDGENTEVVHEPQKHKNIRGREYYSQKSQLTNITSDKGNGNNK